MEEEENNRCSFIHCNGFDYAIYVAWCTQWWAVDMVHSCSSLRSLVLASSSAWWTIYDQIGCIVYAQDKNNSNNNAPTFDELQVEHTHSEFICFLYEFSVKRIVFLHYSLFLLFWTIIVVRVQKTQTNERTYIRSETKQSEGTAREEKQRIRSSEEWKDIIDILFGMSYGC